NHCFIMLRYCTYCKKEYDFDPLAVSGRDDLICPECGNIISKESRDPSRREVAEKTEEAIGNIYARLLHLSYIFYLSMSIVGVIGFISGFFVVLYAATIISLVAFILQLITGTLIFRSGIIFLPIGAILGYLYFRSLEGACLGIHVIFLIRHMIRDIIFRLIFAFIRLVSGA
ncbi:MAG: hypothetical protein IJV16_00490, partial [Lachnospiraceae bacterium]|nr:hypothetical protein [Lachnospiraceae bacterium]